MPPRGFKAADWADKPEDVCNAADQPLYKTAELRWSRPTIWAKEQRLPKFDTDEPFLYALIRNHGNSQTRDHIEYIGLTKAPKTRFGNHKKAKAIVNKRGSVKFSYAPVDFIRGRNRIERIGRALEEIEHLLIWAVPDHLENEKKQFTLPGMGKNGANAWHIKNSGYRFSGWMPREIIFPWMLMRARPDQTAK
ncbi:MAG: hypothetical protein KF777_24475 [Planctomycetaceae bacterium]|nr:hypothetical protein [Planctomycetaceae bacterium]